jgi:tetratricopeptide (TPR) repeat protein
MADPTSFYQILGVDRDADERTIKKAYFTLVRKHPPETHAAEFQRLREAYEILSNPQSRAEYDAVPTYDAPGTAAHLAVQLRAAVEAMDQSDWPRAQGELTAVLDEKPDLHFARDLLGMAYLNAHRPADALREFARLTTEQPQHAAYRLHQGYAHYAQNQYQPALDCYRQASAIDPSDARALVATADCLVALKQYEPALAQLDRALALDDAVDMQDFVFLMRRVQIQLLRDRADLADAELDRIAGMLPDDAETRKYVATRLAALASDLFALKRSADANRLLGRCQKLDPSRRSMEYTFPARARLAIAALPPASRDWIAEHASVTTAGQLAQNAKAAPLAWLAVAIGLQLAALAIAFGSAAIWDWPRSLMMLALLVAPPIALAAAVLRLRRVFGSRYGRYTIVHPCHVLQVDIDHVTVWPLVNLHDVALDHHRSGGNGSYSYTQCRLNFAGARCRVVIRGQQAAIDWADVVLEQRRKVLDLLGMGLLEAEEGFDLVPPALLQPSPAVAPRLPDRAAARWYALAAVAGALTFAAALRDNGDAPERQAWRTVADSGNPERLRGYLDVYPDGPHAARARRELQAIYAHAIVRFRADPMAATPLGHAIVLALGALQRADGAPAQLVVTPTIDLAGATQPGLVAPMAAFGDVALRNRNLMLLARLQGLLAQTIGPGKLGLDYDRRATQLNAPVTFALGYRVQPTDAVYRTKSGLPRSFCGLSFDFELTMIDDGGRELYRLRHNSRQSVTDVTKLPAGGEDDLLPYYRMTEAAFVDLLSALGRDLGLPR